jgi:hypothetical protein
MRALIGNPLLVRFQLLLRRIRNRYVILHHGHLRVLQRALGCDGLPGARLVGRGLQLQEETRILLELKHGILRLRGKRVVIVSCVLAALLIG